MWLMGLLLYMQRNFWWVLSIQIFFFSQGYFIQPTVIETSDPQDKIMQEVIKIDYLKNLIL